MFSPNRESPYKSKSSLKLSDIESKFSQMDFTLFIRITRWCEKWCQCKKYGEVSLISKLQELKGFRQSWKLCRHLCSLRCLRPTLRQVRNIKPFGSNILYMLVWNGRIKDNNLLLNIEIDLQFLMFRSKFEPII